MLLMWSMTVWILMLQHQRGNSQPTSIFLLSFLSCVHPFFHEVRLLWTQWVTTFCLFVCFALETTCKFKNFSHCVHVKDTEDDGLFLVKAIRQCLQMVKADVLVWSSFSPCSGWCVTLEQRGVCVCVCVCVCVHVCPWWCVSLEYSSPPPPIWCSGWCVTMKFSPPPPQAPHPSPISMIMC